MQPPLPVRTKPAPVIRSAPAPVPPADPRRTTTGTVADLYLLKEQTIQDTPSFDGGDLYESLIAQAGAEHLRLHGDDVYARVYSPSLRRAKRAFDLVGALLGLLVFAPVLLLAALWVQLSSPGPVIFRQERLGQNGRWFHALKFRTMYADAEVRLQEMLAADPALRVEYQKYHKLANDPRVTPAGRFLRKHSLDELPQILNVLRGDMSLVGPRAYLPFEVPDMSDSERILVILQVKPGITGFWQVGGRNNVSFDERLDMDVFYVKQWSLGMDLYIVLNTAWLMLFSRGYGAS